MVDWISVSREGGTPGEEVGPEEGKGPGGVAAGVDGDQGEGGRESFRSSFSREVLFADASRAKADGISPKVPA